MPLKDLITDAATGQLSHAKIWANVAYATATLIVIIMAVNGTLGGEIFLCYLAGVGMSAAASKFASMKLGPGSVSLPSQGDAGKGTNDAVYRP
ncbi:hypothetical protein HZB60_04055 [candidate division KSB1 bacterium]|nr:hypothetical protein [candidate division KSB1 bacterium]